MVGTASQARLEFAARLRELREQRGFSQASELASAIGLETLRYARIERGEVEPNIRTILAICVALKVDPNTLLGFKSK